MSDEVQNFLAWCQERNQNKLSQLLQEQDLPSQHLRDAVAYSLLAGGKRVRPALVYAATQACGEAASKADYFACAVEAIHCYSLIHDDLPAMDDDDLRRGKPTNHKVHGEAMAILAGDLLQSLAFEWLCLAPDIPPANIVAAQSCLARGAGLMVAGQALDIDAANTHKTLAELEIMHRNKTGALIETSMLLGGLAAGAEKDQLEALKCFGNAIGLAFQVKDDILDIEADTATLGKQQGADLSQNKPTYVSLLGLDGAKQHAKALHKDALNALAVFDESANTLRYLAEYIVKRHY